MTTRATDLAAVLCVVLGASPPLAAQAPRLAAPKGLVAHWEFRGDLKDSSGNGHDGIGRNVAFAAGPHGVPRTAALFNGRDSVVEVSDAEPLRLEKGDFSLAVWIRPDSPMRTVFGDIVSKFEPARRRGINLSLAGSACSYSGMSDSRHVHFGIDDGYLGKWEDCGKPCDSNSLVSCLIVYEGELYCGIADAAKPQDAAHVFRWKEGKTWEDCGRLGSDPGHLSVQSMIVHDGRLYAGTGIWWNWSRLEKFAPTHVFVYEGGKSWRDLGQVGSGSRVLCLGSYGGELYAGLDRAGGGKCFKYQGRQWIDCGAPDGRNFECLMPLAGKLYGATHGNMYLYGGGANWTCIGRSPYEENQIHCLGVFGGKLHAGCWPSGHILRYEGGEKWVSTGRPNATGSNNEVNDLLVHNGKLYGGLIPRAEVYRYETDGNWTLLKSLAANTAAKGSAAWCRVNALCSHRGRLWASTGSCTGEPQYVDPEGTLGRVYSLQLGLMVSHERDIGPGWTHLAAVRQGQQLLLYVNGQLSRQADAPEGRLFDLSNNEPLRIGFGAESFFAGAMADLRLYREALGAQEVKSLNQEGDRQ